MLAADGRTASIQQCEPNMTPQTLNGRCLVPGSGIRPVLHADVALSFMGCVDAVSGEVRETFIIRCWASMWRARFSPSPRPWFMFGQPHHF